MKGLDSFEINRSLTLDELALFMQSHWNKEEYGDFIVGDPLGADTKTKYIVLPADDTEAIERYSHVEG